MQIYKLILLTLSLVYGYQYLIDLLIDRNLTKRVPIFLLRKPFVCPTCLTIWIGVLLSIFNPEFIYYVIPVAIFTETINRHFK